MGDPPRLSLASRRLAAALLALVLGASLGCASLMGSLRKSLREPGLRLHAFPEAVWQEYDCDEQKLPFFRIEKLELLPKHLRPGGEFNHRLVYVLCPDAPTAVVDGTLHTRILFRGRPIVTESDHRWEFRPGRWSVDAFVSVPDDAQTGIYAMELEFRGPKLRFTERLTFAVESSGSSPGES